jgi:hypothetical protein
MFVLCTRRWKAILGKNMISKIQQQLWQGRLTGSHVWRGHLPWFVEAHPFQTVVKKCRIWESATFSTFHHRPGSSSSFEFCHSSSQTRVPLMSATRSFSDTQACGHCLVPGYSSRAKLISHSDGSVHPPICLLVHPVNAQPIHTD